MNIRTSTVVLLLFMFVFAPSKSNAQSCSSGWCSVSGYAGIINKNLNDTHLTKGLFVQEIVFRPYAWLTLEISPETSVFFSGENRVSFGSHEMYLRADITRDLSITGGNFITPWQTWKGRFHEFPDNDASASQPWESAFGPMRTNGFMINGKNSLGSARFQYIAYAGWETDVENVFRGTRDIIGSRLQITIPSLQSTLGSSIAIDDYLSSKNRMIGAYYLQKFSAVPVAMSNEIATTQAAGWSYWNTTAIRLKEKSHVIFKFETLKKREHNFEYPYQLSIPNSDATDMYLGLRHWFKSLRISALYKFGVSNAGRGLVTTVFLRW